MVICKSIMQMDRIFLILSLMKFFDPLPQQYMSFSSHLSSNIIYLGKLVKQNCNVSIVLYRIKNRKVIGKGPKCGQLFPLQILGACENIFLFLDFVVLLAIMHANYRINVLDILTQKKKCYVEFRFAYKLITKRNVMLNSGLLIN